MRGSIPLDVDPAATMRDNQFHAASHVDGYKLLVGSLWWAASKKLSTLDEEHVGHDKLRSNTVCRCTFSCSFTANLKCSWRVRPSQV